MNQPPNFPEKELLLQATAELEAGIKNPPDVLVHLYAILRGPTEPNFTDPDLQHASESGGSSVILSKLDRDKLELWVKSLSLLWQIGTLTAGIPEMNEPPRNGLSEALEEQVRETRILLKSILTGSPSRSVLLAVARQRAFDRGDFTAAATFSQAEWAHRNEFLEGLAEG